MRGLARSSCQSAGARPTEGGQACRRTAPGIRLDGVQYTTQLHHYHVSASLPFANGVANRVSDTGLLSLQSGHDRLSNCFQHPTSGNQPPVGWWKQYVGRPCQFAVPLPCLCRMLLHGSRWPPVAAAHVQYQLAAMSLMWLAPDLGAILQALTSGCCAIKLGRQPMCLANVGPRCTPKTSKRAMRNQTWRLDTFG